MRLRSRLRRSSLLFWSITLAVAAATGLTVGNLAAEAAARAAALGGLREVPVATRSVPAGHVLQPSDVALRRLPRAAVPAGPVAGSAVAVGRATVVDVVAGEVLLAAKLAPGTVRGVAVLLPAGMRALAVPRDTGGLALERGHRVDVLATFDVEGAPAGAGDEAEADDAAPTFPVATAALVIDVAEEAVTVAVSPDEAPRVAFAMARGTVTLALTSPLSNWEE